MKATLKIAGTTRRYASLGYTKRLSQIGVWDGELKEILALDKWSPTIIQRLGADDFVGWLEAPTRQWGKEGNSMPVGGTSLEGILLEKRTPHAVMTNTSLNTVLDTILSLSGFTRGTVGDFYMVKDPWELPADIYGILGYAWNDTYPKLLCQIEDNTAKTFTGDIYHIIKDHFEKGGYWYAMCYHIGVTSEVGYIWSDDGTNWSAYVPLTADPTRTPYAATLRNGFLYFFNDGNMYKCTVNAGAIVLGAIVGSPPAGVGYLTVWDSDGHIWHVNTTGHCQESIDDGVNWSDRFTTTNAIYGIIPKSANGDLWLLEYDAVNNDLELWEWDEATDTESYVDQIYDGDGATYPTDAKMDCDPEGNLHFSYVTFDGTTKYRRRLVSGVYDAELTLEAAYAGLVHKLCVDGGGAAWVGYGKNGATTVTIRKIVDSAVSETYTFDAGTVSMYIGCSNLVCADTKVVWFSSSVARDGNMLIFKLDSLELCRGKTSGYFTTDAQSGDGDYEKWGLLAHDADYESGVSYDILDAGDDSVALSDVVAPADLDALGLDPAITDIKLKGKLAKVGSDYPAVYMMALSERHTKLDIDTDGESVWEALAKIKAQIGGEVQATSDWKVNYLNRIGSDKSASIILRTARSASRPDVAPTIQNLVVEGNYSGWANCIRVIGAGVYPARYEAEVKDSSSVAAQAAIEGGNGEHWKVVRCQDVKSDGMAATKAAIELAEELDNDYLRYSTEFIDTTGAGDIDIGDTVTLIDDPPGCATPVNGAYRIVELSRRWEGGETTRIALAGRPHGNSYSEHLLKIEDIKRWVV
jgi:hypothetical protein